MAFDLEEVLLGIKSPKRDALREFVRALEEQAGDGEVTRLTEAQTRFAIQKMSLWLCTREKHQAEYLLGFNVFGKTVAEVKRVLNQVAADVDHSSLLHRLLRGRPLLPEPPPTQHSYPAYPDWPYIDA